MPDISTIKIKTVKYDIADLKARAELDAKMDDPGNGVTGQVLTKTQDGCQWLPPTAGLSPEELESMYAEAVKTHSEDNAAHKGLFDAKQDTLGVGESGQFLVYTSDGPRWVDLEMRQYLQVRIPTPTNMTEKDIYYTLRVEFSNNEDFSDPVIYTENDCQVFNPATGLWIDCPEDGVDISMSESFLRLKQGYWAPYIRYRWSLFGGQHGPWHVL